MIVNKKIFTNLNTELTLFQTRTYKIYKLSENNIRCINYDINDKLSQLYLINCVYTLKLKYNSINTS